MHGLVRSDCTVRALVSEQRGTPRLAITLPVLIVLGRKRYTAELRNISTTGAMIVTSAPMLPQSRIELQCGTICCLGTVHWQRQSDFGIKFRTPICVRQLDEQTARSIAIASRRARPEPSIARLS